MARVMRDRRVVIRVVHLVDQRCERTHDGIALDLAVRGPLAPRGFQMPRRNAEVLQPDAG
ncbi:hypothetical protein [Streptomyces sp. WAC 06783]|uniref:hypothetical protein n=1 Tax=Streptomyces sp. WAC 06783 TaxID=2203211 RepID=UPI000F74A609|nr:hypothetical protein [Streptomyces sp. WAC 06783]